MRKIINEKTILTVALMASPLFAAAAAKAKSIPYLEWTYENIFLVLGAMVAAGVGITLWNAMNGIVEYQKREMLKEQGIEYIPPQQVKKDSIFKKMYDYA